MPIELWPNECTEWSTSCTGMLLASCCARRPTSYVASTVQHLTYLKGLEVTLSYFREKEQLLSVQYLLEKLVLFE